MTEFEKKVLREVLKIPLGETRTYKWVATRVGRPNAYRAVANALRKNPYPLFIPCHRVVSSNNKIGGYSLGVELKRDLIKLEKKIRDMIKDKIEPVRLIVATKNKNKFKEIKKIIKGVKIPVICWGELEGNIEIKEDGKSFFENALKKAQTVSKYYPQDLVVGEDSGLEVEALGNEPGIFSRRYSGKHSTDLKNNLKVLHNLAGKEGKERKACFRCVVVLVKGGKLIKKFEGKLRGFIYHKMVGKRGFGYDPIFYLPRYKKTVAQLSLREKNKISHRAQAFSKLKEYILTSPHLF
ncbi:MAG: non-canonical purine NTP pyrophosphatase, RdgB/HAM1 family [Candidatus Omnitrophica bacterium 4484_70.2]|nr:MAG: non-canonical purine NTP pyrophosphatase, RdgB/HAM1 family [Candidatus Omnitrophica bacterium 4484_70.2]